MKCRLPFLCIILCVACLSGCSKPRIDLVVASQPNVNPDYSGRPSPVIVKMYELRRDVAFKQADFQTLFEQPVQTLGADLIAADELVLTPGEVRRIAYQPGENTRFVGLVAGFRHMERAQWRAIQSINPESGNTVAMELNDASILLIPEKEASSWQPEEAIRLHQQDPGATDSQNALQRPMEQPVTGHEHDSAGGLERNMPSPPVAQGSPGAPQPYKQQVPAMRPIQSQ
ncbi:MAG: type VI secretion system lipoprotein TssJ [Betaproteobacteria bacterium]|nr:type VI secretion system lipoprotein TssJ [Betaproteobacteria bacterium]